MRSPDGDKGKQSNKTNCPSESAITEFDEFMESLYLSGLRDYRAWGAFGPGWATEPRTGEPDQGACDDDRALGRDVGHQSYSKPGPWGWATALLCFMSGWLVGF